MKRMIVLCLLAMVLAGVPAAAMTGNELKKYSDEGEKYPNGWCDGFFLGYVSGLQDMWEATADRDKTGFERACIPKDVTNEQVFEEVRKYYLIV